MKKTTIVVVLLTMFVWVAWANPFVGRWKVTVPMETRETDRFEIPDNIVVWIFDDNGNVTFDEQGDQEQYRYMYKETGSREGELSLYNEDELEGHMKYVVVSDQTIETYYLFTDQDRRGFEAEAGSHWDIYFEDLFTKVFILMEKRSDSNPWND